MPGAAEISLLVAVAALAAAVEDEHPSKEDQLGFVTGPLEALKESLYQLWQLLPIQDERSKDIELLLHVATSVRIYFENEWKEVAVVRMGLPKKSCDLPDFQASSLPAPLLKELKSDTHFMEHDAVMLKSGAWIWKCAAHVKKCLS